MTLDGDRVEDRWGNEMGGKVTFEFRVLGGVREKPADDPVDEEDEDPSGN